VETPPAFPPVVSPPLCRYYFFPPQPHHHGLVRFLSAFLDWPCVFFDCLAGFFSPCNPFFQPPSPTFFVFRGLSTRFCVFLAHPQYFCDFKSDLFYFFSPLDVPFFLNFRSSSKATRGDLIQLFFRPVFTIRPLPPLAQHTLLST